MSTYFDSVPKELLELLLKHLPHLEVLREFTVPEIPAFNAFWNDDKFWKSLYQRDLSENLQKNHLMSTCYCPPVTVKADVPKPPPPPALPPEQSRWKIAYIKAMSDLSDSSLEEKIDHAATNGWEKVLVKSFTVWKKLLTRYFNGEITLTDDDILRENDDFIYIDDTWTKKIAFNMIQNVADFSLQVAASFAQFHIVKLLVEDYKADVELDDSAALILACVDGSESAPQIAKYLIEKGANIFAGSEEAVLRHDLVETTPSLEADAPIELSIRSGNLELFKYILSKAEERIKEEITQENKTHHKSAVELKKIEKYVKSNYLNSQLQSAIIERQRRVRGKDDLFRIIRFLIEEAGADIKEPVSIVTDDHDPENNPIDLMEIAIDNNDHELVRYFIDHGFVINSLGLDTIVQSNNFTLLKYLFENGYSNEAGKCSGLISAANEGNFEMVKFLVEKGTNIDGQSPEVPMRSTPLIQACELCRHHAPPQTQAVIEYLVDKGADVQYYGNAAFTNAVMTGNLPLVKYLLDHGADIGVMTPELLLELIDNCSDSTAKKDKHTNDHDTDYYETFKFILSKCPRIFSGEPPKTKNSKGEAIKYIDALFLMVTQKGFIDLVKYCLSNGANMSIENHKATRLAAVYGHLHILKYLHERGSDIHNSNYQNLREACRHGHLDIVKYLVENKANVNSYNLGEFLNPLRAAGVNRHFHIVKYLLEKGADVTVLKSKERKNFKIKQDPETKKYDVNLSTIKTKKQKRANKKKAPHNAADILAKLVAENSELFDDVDMDTSNQSNTNLNEMD